MNVSKIEQRRNKKEMDESFEAVTYKHIYQIGGRYYILYYSLYYNTFIYFGYIDF